MGKYSWLTYLLAYVGKFLPMLAYFCIWLKKSVNLVEKNNIFGKHFIFKDRAAKSCPMLTFFKNQMEV